MFLARAEGYDGYFQQSPVISSVHAKFSAWRRWCFSSNNLLRTATMILNIGTNIVNKEKVVIVTCSEYSMTLCLSSLRVPQDLVALLLFCIYSYRYEDLIKAKLLWHYGTGQLVEVIFMCICALTYVCLWVHDCSCFATYYFIEEVKGNKPWDIYYISFVFCFVAQDFWDYIKFD